MQDRAAIIPDMTIFGSDGVPVGRVHHMAGIQIVVDRIGTSRVDLYRIPLSWVAAVTDRVTLNRPAAEARRAPSTTSGPQPRKLLRIAGIAVAVLGAFGLVFENRGLIMQHDVPAEDAGARQAPPVAAPVAPIAPAPKDTVATAAAAPQQSLATAPGTAPSLSGVGSPMLPTTRSTGLGGVATALAGTPAMIAYLDSPAQGPRAFPIGDTALAALDRRDRHIPVIEGMADVMNARLNMRIKLAASGGGALAVRRLTAIRAALVGRGVAPYRIATGVGGRAVRARPGVQVIVLTR